MSEIEQKEQFYLTVFTKLKILLELEDQKPNLKPVMITLDMNAKLMIGNNFLNIKSSFKDFLSLEVYILYI